MREAELQFVQVGQQAQRPFVEHRAVGGQADPAGRAVEQFEPQTRFQLLHQLGDAGATQVQGLRGLGEAAGLDDSHEGLHGVETVHRASSL